VNLEFISAKENLTKRDKCSFTLDELKLLYDNFERGRNK